MRNTGRVLFGVMALLLLLFLQVGASALETLDPNELFYITGAVSKPEISRGDADGTGNYPLSYTASAMLPDLLGTYITTYSEYVTNFSFRIDVILANGQTVDTDSLHMDCAFGEITGASAAGRMLYIDVALKGETKISDYTYEQWTSPITLYFDTALDGASFDEGERIAVALSVSGWVTGSHELLGDLSIAVRGGMDPNLETIVTRMVPGEERHTAQDPAPPPASTPETIKVSLPPMAAELAGGLLPTPQPDTTEEVQPIPTGTTTVPALNSADVLPSEGGASAIGQPERETSAVPILWIVLGLCTCLLLIFWRIRRRHR